MTRRVLTLVSLLACGTWLGAQEAVFRQHTDVVRVDVSVREGTRVVADLSAGDFELRDRGAVQAIEDVTFESVPIETTLVVDVSGSVDGPLLAAITRAVDGVRARLRPTDSVTLVRFNQRFAETAVTSKTDLRAFFAAPAGQTSLLDALIASLIRPRDPLKRQLTILMTDGADTLSFLDEASVQAIVARADSAVFVVAVTDGVVSALPHRGLFTAISSATGGRFAVLGRRGELDKAFVQALDDFRQSYVLRYTVKGESPPGWHDVDVRVLRPGRYEVRARRGYFVSSTMPSE